MKELQNSLDNKLQSYCQYWDNKINVNKTNVMVFGNYRNKLPKIFTLQNKSVEIIKLYKYLGILLHRIGKFSDSVKDLYNIYNKSLK